MKENTTKTGMPLRVRPFSAMPTMIPEFIDGEFTGNPYRIEGVLVRADGKPETDEDPGDGGGARMHVWLAPDRRTHNHPWRRIYCKVVRGWYTARESRLGSEADIWIDTTTTLRAGDPEHVVDHDTYHEVVEVEPGTVSIMTFGPVVGSASNWGHLIAPTDERPSRWHDSDTNQPGFRDALLHLNPHMKRPSDWVDPYAHMAAPCIDDVLTSVGL